VFCLLIAAPVAGRLFAAAPEPPSLRAQPFELSQIRLLDGPFLRARQLNERFLSSLDLDRQLHAFRLTAGLPTTAEPMGGWESPSHGGRGEFFGHSLSARAMLYAATGEKKWKDQLDYLVAELAKCQAKFGTSGYLHTEPESVFDQMERENKGEGVYYTVHKIMAGLLDVHHYCTNSQALEIAEKMADWVEARSGRFKPDDWQRVLNVEYGGMNDVLYALYAVTHNPRHLETARRFDHERIFAPLAEGRDELKGLHANTTIPKIIGAARAFEVTGTERDRKVAEYFWREVSGHRCYATGGTSNFEFWRTAPDELSNELSMNTHECCCTYNLLKLARKIFTWTADPSVADYYERALFNGVLGTQNPENGLTMYFLPMAGGYWKTFATPFDSFWCCTGTGAESFAKFGDSIYFHDADALWVNLFIASTLAWPEKGLTLRQSTRFPEEQCTSLEFEAKEPVELALRIRVPHWASQDASMTLNGSPIEIPAKPGTYAEIRRTWKSGDHLSVKTPMRLHLNPMPDDKNLAAIMYGPLVLAGKFGELTPRELDNHNTGPADPPVPVPTFKGSANDLASWIAPVSGKPLEFRTSGQQTDVTLVPLCMLFDQRYAVYWKIAPRN
jgi:DUF1680 family protein